MRGYLSPWYRVCTKAIGISKGKYGNVEPKNAILVSVQKEYFPLRATSKIRASPSRGKFGATFPHGTVFALRQEQFQKKATGMYNLKMQSLFRCKRSTSHFVDANFRDSCIAVLGRQWKFGEIQGYLSQWYRICTKAISISKGSYGNVEPKNVILFSVQKEYFPKWG